MKTNLKDHKRKTGIYCIRNKINNKVYIGQAICIYQRIGQHITQLNTKSKDENEHLINSWHKYGRSNFEYFVLEFCKKEELKERELFWILSYKSNLRENGYNFRLDTSTGMIASQETREKMRKSQLKRFEDPEERRKSGIRSKEFWKNNPEKLAIMIEKVVKIQLKYRIHQFDKNTNELIHIWESMRDLLKANPQYKRHNIYAVCSEEKPSMYGYRWKKVMI